ncbi:MULTISPECIES: M13 family metallopeptidase [Vagococcus]|uniref:Neutral endopeptidase O n=1 Tax=Vagococcus fluvialis bH819 TaxID=1255619 RepID=A0A1X6WKK3_9ENTE|nr:MULTISPECIES: M13 family metallopeptidase [Vagococcus]SLM84779.1 Neutral endopeptidase O [Vagococcus fluvialis bH819]HCM89761.1 peptidase M13 [Vagococcus sp.]
MDKNINLAKKDFYEYVNKEWLTTAEIPNDKPVINSFSVLNDEIEKLLMVDVKKIALGEISAITKELQSFADFYRLVSDNETREKLGVAPLNKRLETIESLKNLTDFDAQLSEWTLSSYPIPFSIYVSPDMKQSDTYAISLAPTSLILPDTTYYSDEHPNKKELLSTFKEMMLDLLSLLGKPKEEANLIVSDAIAFDESLVPFIRSSEESADYTKEYNPKNLQEIAQYHSDIHLDTFITSLLGQVPKEVIVTEPEYFENIKKIITTETFTQLKNWMIVRETISLGSLLTEEFREISSRYQLALSGAKEIISAEKLYFYTATGQFDQVIGQYYAESYFGIQAKKDVEDMIKKMIHIYQERLTKNNWLEQATKNKAILKLNELGIQVGFPEKTPAIYSLFKTQAKENGGTLIDNVVAFSRITLEDYFKRYNTKVDRNEWEMSADTVNAYYHPQKNVIVFPAAILQSPFYDFKQTRSQNYGGIGAVIAHEISHAFDNNGAKFDEFGNLNDWWTEKDLAHFEELTQKMIAQFDQIPFGNGKVNGTLTVSENIADAGGLSCALEAAQLEDDYNGHELFENWARIWRHKAQDQYTDLLLAVDVHGPNKLRANIQVKNLETFHELYNVTKEDEMYLAPEKRISIW